MLHGIFLRSLIQLLLPVVSAIFIVMMGCGGDSDVAEDAGSNVQGGTGGTSASGGTGTTPVPDGTSGATGSDGSIPSMDSSTSPGDGSTAIGGSGGSGTMDSSTAVTGGTTGDTGGTSGSGAGGAGGSSGGTGGNQATGGSGGSDSEPVTCDGEVCEAPSGSVLTPCCVEDGDDEICGGRLNDECLPWEMGGELDSTCPDYRYSMTVTLDGCCTTDDMCGVWSTQGLECIERTLLDDYLGLEEELPERECGIVDEDAGT